MIFALTFSLLVGDVMYHDRNPLAWCVVWVLWSVVLFLLALLYHDHLGLAICGGGAFLWSKSVDHHLRERRDEEI